MSALQQLANFPEQPRVPSPWEEPPPIPTWLRGQPTEQPKPPERARESQYIQWEGPKRGVRRDLALNELEQAYVFGDRSAVAAFMEQNRFRGLLLEAREPLNAAFGEGAVKKLTLVTDDEGFTTLFCLVLVPGDMQEARRALRSFDQRWWLGRSTQAAGKLNFDFELI